MKRARVYEELSKKLKMKMLSDVNVLIKLDSSTLRQYNVTVSRHIGEYLTDIVDQVIYDRLYQEYEESTGRS